MEEVKIPKSKFDVAVVVLMIGLVVGGFWIIAVGGEARMDAMQIKLSQIDRTVTEMAQQVNQLHNFVDDLQAILPKVRVAAAAQEAAPALADKANGAKK